MVNKIFTFLILFQFCLGNEGEFVKFTSANPFSFYHIITDLGNQDPHEVHGILRFPAGVERKNLPLVIAAAGSKDWADHHLEYLSMYRDMGVATFELQSFASRDIKSTVGTQVDVTTAMMILDAYRALDTLIKDPRINPQRVAITGWSLGGAVSLFSAWQPLKDAISPEGSFSAHLPIYPPCIVKPEKMEFTEAPIHILIGKLDNWVPASACEDLVADMQATGVDIGITVYPDAHHGFDREGPLVVEENGYALSDCRFRMRADGAVLMNFLNIPMTKPYLQKLALAFCADRGPTLGGNPEAREASYNFAKAFMTKHLLDYKK